MGGGYAIVFNYVARFYKNKYLSSKDATKNEESDTAVFVVLKQYNFRSE